MKFTHVSDNGDARMVDISNKEIVHREAVATGKILLQPATVQMIKENQIAKGDVISVARIAGIGGAKKTAGLIPLCHSIPLHHINLDFIIAENDISIVSRVVTDAKTGVEMEALTAVATAALTIYDMCKAVDKTMKITDIMLVEKVKHGLRG
jgi:cyclic pyranopterin phosphate synthase